MQEDLRGFLEKLEHQGKFKRITTEVEIENLPVLMHKAAKEGYSVCFEGIKGFDYSLVNNILGGQDFLALAFGCTREEVVPQYIARCNKPLEPVLIDEAPVQEVVKILPADSFDIREFPFVKHSAKDADRYITAGMVIVKDPETGIRNVSINRMQLKGPDKLGIRMMPPQHLGVIYEKAEKLGRPLEVAVAIGNHPLDLIAAVTSTDFGVDELTLAGALRQEPVEVVKCKTVDLEVPANAEVIIEGVILPREREAEGPFGDFIGYYVPVMANHVLHIKAITHRQKPILQAIKAGSIEDTHLLAISREAQIYEAVKRTRADILAVTLNPMIFSCVISLRKKFADEAKNVMLAAFGSYSWMKTCIIVDHDVDAYDLRDVWWAVSTRCRPETGALILPNAVGFPRDPYRVHQSKLGIDATAPLNQWEEFERITLF